MLSCLVLVGVGAFVIWESTHYQLGALNRMGPGFFPMVLGFILIGFGLLLLLPGIDQPEPDDEVAEGGTDFRAWVHIVGGIVGFIVLGRHGGLVPATFFLVFLSALADRANTLKSAAILATAMSVVAAVVFVWMLGVQIPLFRWG